MLVEEKESKPPLPADEPNRSRGEDSRREERPWRIEASFVPLPPDEEQPLKQRLCSMVSAIARRRLEGK